MSKDKQPRRGGQRGTAELDAFLHRHPETAILELLQPDMNGVLRGKRVGREDFAKAYEPGVNFCAATTMLDTKGQTFAGIDEGGRDGDPDALARAVPGSLARVPWAARPSAQVLMCLEEPTGGPYYADPRNVLRRAAKPLAELGLQPVVATELEFYLVESADRAPAPRLPRIPGTPLRQDGLQFASLEDLADVDPFLTELAAACEAQRIPASTAVAEFAPGQFEVNLKHVADPVLACDHAVLLKRAVKAIAARHGFGASFMAKPFAELAGCSLHVHVSLLDAAGQNVFAGRSADGPFSDTLRHAVAGLAATMAEGMAIFAPNANSYRRFRPGLFVPLTPNWGLNHRSVALRVPLSGEADTRIEHRPGGADGNPYLVMAALLAGIHHGISERVEPEPPVQAGQVLEEERVTLPVRWDAALDAFEAGTVLPRYLGADYHRIFAACRREESERFHAEISDRDYAWYLRAV